MCYSVMVKQNRKYLKDHFLAVEIREDFDEFSYRSSIDPKKYKPLEEHARIYPNYYAPIIISGENASRRLTPMRYRVLPSWSNQEIPTKYNLFNARIDSLEQRRTWKNLFGKRHGILVFERFYEWVTDKNTGKKKIVSFKPKDQDVMWAPVLWDHWRGYAPHTDVTSFAIITTDPPPEVSQMGHDRCPIFLRRDLIDAWLNPDNKSKKDLYAILDSQEPAYFECSDAAAFKG